MDALGLGEPARQVPTGGGSWLGKLALFVTLACLAVVGLIGMYFMGRVMVFPPISDGSGTPKGDCFILDPSWCVSLNVEFVQKLSRVRFPPGAEVIDSGASQFLFSGSDRATVRWPEGSPMPDLPAWLALAPSGASSDGFARVDATWNLESGRYRTTVQLGVGADDRPRLELVRGWDG